MTLWDGQGLPPAAEARMERAHAGGPTSSLLSIAGQAAIEGCGFSIVGEVMGCIVEHIGFQGYGGCGYYYGGMGGGIGGLGGALGYRGGGGLGGGTVTSGSGLGSIALPAEALYHGYDTAMVRMLTECRELGGDGVVGVSLTAKHLGEGNRRIPRLRNGRPGALADTAGQPLLDDVAGQRRRQAAARWLGARVDLDRHLPCDPPRRLGDVATGTHLGRQY